MKEIKVDADTNNLQKVFDFLDRELLDIGCDEASKMQIKLSVEELFVNIASYAYGQDGGFVKILSDFDGDDKSISVTFVDEGIPYNPLEKEDPDVTLSASERQIGGLGVFLVKQTMDEVSYDYKDGQNIFTFKKKVQ